MKPFPLKHSRRPIQVARDDEGVPHITAENWEDGLYGLGYMHALDRGTHRVGDAQQDELDSLCLSSIARFKRPKDYVFIDALPKNNYGKVLKTELRALDSKKAAANG